MDTTTIIQSQKYTTTDKATLKSCREKLALLEETSAAFRPAEEGLREGVPSGLLDRIYSTGGKFEEDPTPENFEAHLMALMVSDCEQRHRRRLRDLCRNMILRATSPYATIATGILDRAIAEVNKAEESRREAAEAAGLAAEHSAKFANLRASLEGEREAIKNNAGAWLASYGFEV